MPLSVGDTIEIVRRGDPGGWCTGKLGSFPTDYVQFLAPEADATPALISSGTIGSSSPVVLPGTTKRETTSPSYEETLKKVVESNSHAQEQSKSTDTVKMMSVVRDQSIFHITIPALTR
jgi:hypothetical protein